MKNYKKNIIIMVIFTLVLFSGLLYKNGKTYAKYISDSVWNYYLKSKGFYFSSDYLDIEEKNTVDNLWNGESVNFNIKNNMNQNLITEYDINYTVTCEITGDASEHARCVLNGTDESVSNGVLSHIQVCENNEGDEVDVTEFDKVNCEMNGYDWISKVAVKDMYFDVVSTDENYIIENVTVKINAKSNSPYEKTLTGSFSLHRAETSEGNFNVEYKNYESYDRLIISSLYSTDKCIKVNWNSDEIIIDLNPGDSESYETDENDYINEIKLELKAGRTVSYIFYKRNKEVSISKDDFTVEETIACN